MFFTAASGRPGSRLAISLHFCGNNREEGAMPRLHSGRVFRVETRAARTFPSSCCASNRMRSSCSAHSSRLMLGSRTLHHLQSGTSVSAGGAGGSRFSVCCCERRNAAALRLCSSLSAPAGAPAHCFCTRNPPFPYLLRGAVVEHFARSLGPFNDAAVHEALTIPGCHPSA